MTRRQDIHRFMIREHTRDGYAWWTGKSWSLDDNDAATYPTRARAVSEMLTRARLMPCETSAAIDVFVRRGQ